MRKIIKIIFAILLFSSSLRVSAQINTDKVLQSGVFALNHEEYVLAISFFNKAINSRPYLGVPYYYRAKAKYSLDDFKGAEQDMNKAIDISPFYVEFFSFRGNVRDKIGNNEGAIKDYSKGLSIEPNFVSIYFNRGLVYMGIKQYDKAIEDYTSVLKLKPAEYGAYINRAIAKLNLKDTIGAVIDMDDAIEVNPLVADAYRFSAYLYYEINNFEKALLRINEAINIDGDESMYYSLRGAVRYQIDDLEGTLADFNKVVELEPKNAMGYSNRGILRVEIGDVNNAINDFSRVLAINPNDLLTLFNRSLLYIRVGQFREAVSDLNLIINHYPDYPDAYLAISQAYMGLNMEQRSRQNYNMAVKLSQDERKKAEKLAKAGKAGGKENGKPKATRTKSDNNIDNHDKIAVLDDFSVDDDEVEDIESLKGKIQNRNIIIDLEKVYGLTFFSKDSLINRTRYFKPEVTQFNQRKAYEKPLVFSNKEKENEGGDAVKYFNRIKKLTLALSNNPNNSDVRLVRAILYSVVLNYTGAIADYDYLIKNNAGEKSRLYFYYLNRANIRFKVVEMMHSFDEEELMANLKSNSSLSSPVKSNPNENKVVKQMLDYDLIERDLYEVLKLKPNFEFAYYNLGILQCIRKDYERAMVNFDKAIKINPMFAEAYFNRGLTRIFLKDEEAGTLDLSKAGELGMYKAYNVIKRYGMQKETKVEEERED